MPVSVFVFVREDVEDAAGVFAVLVLVRTTVRVPVVPFFVRAAVVAVVLAVAVVVVLAAVAVVVREYNVVVFARAAVRAFAARQEPASAYFVTFALQHALLQHAVWLFLVPSAAGHSAVPVAVRFVAMLALRHFAMLPFVYH